MKNNFRYKWWALLGLSLLAFTAFMDFTIVSTAIPFIQKTFKTPVSQLQWVTGVYGMLMSMVMIISGKIGDAFGRRRIFYFGIFLFVVAAIGAGSSHAIESLIFFRALQGLSGAAIFTQSVALLPQAFPQNEQERAIGVYSAITGFGLAIGPFLSGALISFFSWRWIFWINIPIVLVGITFCSFSLKASLKPSPRPKIDVAGFLLLTLGVGCLIYGLIHGGQYGWGARLSWLNLVIGIISLVLLVIVEGKVSAPLLELNLFKNKYAVLAALICIVSGMILFIFFSFFDALYLKVIRGQAALEVGLTLLAVPLMQVVLSIFLPKLLRIFGVVNFIIVGLAAAFVASLLHVFIGSASHFGFILLSLMLMGIAWGIGNTGAIRAVNQSVSQDKAGGAVGTVFTLWNIAGAVFLAIASVLFQYVEKLKINSLMLVHHSFLNIQQAKVLMTLISDPQHATVALHHLASVKMHSLFGYFELTFLSGYHAVAWMMTVATFIALLFGLLLKARK